MSSLRIFVAAGQDVVRYTIIGLLGAHPGWDICGEAGAGSEIVSKVQELKPDIVLLDFDMAEGSALRATSEIAQSGCRKVILLSAADSAEAASQAFEAGARAFLPKSTITQDLVFAVEALHSGRTYFTPRFAEAILKQRLTRGLSAEKDRMSSLERQNVQLLANELSDPYRHNARRARSGHPLRRYALAGVALAIGAAVAWVTYVGDWDRVIPELHKLSMKVGLRSAPASAYAASDGNPDAKVWIDIHTALYYCPGSDRYGRTPRGRYAKQRDAQMDHFEPAEGKACE